MFQLIFKPLHDLVYFIIVEKIVNFIERRDDRFVPKDAASQITLADGREYECEVIDISVSGAQIKTSVLPSIGTHLSLGRMRGRVVRFTSDGIAIEFMRQIESAKMADHAVL